MIGSINVFGNISYHQFFATSKVELLLVATVKFTEVCGKGKPFFTLDVKIADFIILSINKS